MRAYPKKIPYKIKATKKEESKISFVRDLSNMLI